MHLEAHPHGEELTSLFPIVIDESELSIYTEDDLVEELDASDDVIAELADPAAPAAPTSDLERTHHRDELAALHARDAGLGSRSYAREARHGVGARARLTDPEDDDEHARLASVDLGTGESRAGDPELAPARRRLSGIDLGNELDTLDPLHAREADAEISDALQAREAADELDEDLDLDEDDPDDIEPLAPRRPVTLAERARELASRFAMRVLVPVLAVAMLVVAMGGTWTTAGATPVNPWSATVPPGGRAGPANSARPSTSSNPGRDGSASAPGSVAGSAVGSTAGPSTTGSSAAPSGAAASGELDAPIFRAKSGHGALSGKLNLNTASEDQLMLLPTVGPAKAERIVTWRKKNGGFKRTADLRRVKGFGYKTFKKLEPFLDIKGDTTLVPK